MSARPRIIVTTDPELDDLNSMLRLLLYGNEIDIAALVYSSSCFHWAGDEATEPFRWPAPGDTMHIDTAVNAYEKVHANLVRHDARYPDPAHLRSLIRVGNVKTEGEMDEVTPGSELVKQVLLGDAPGRIFAQAWGGTNTIARALKSIEEEFRGTDRWDSVHRLVSERTVITAFAEQDDTFREYIRPHWPDIEFRDVATTVWGYGAPLVVEGDDREYLEAEWMRENVSSVGPMGAEYRVWGDGKFMAAGFDAEDYFGLIDPTPEELSRYQTFVPVQPAGTWISEGDTSNFAMHIDNGLRNAEHPSYGGWGGRQEPDASDPHRWRSVNPLEFDMSKPPSDAGDTAQWFGAFQRDLAARLRWSVTPEFADANHAPRIVVDGSPDVAAAPGESVDVAFAATDPDGDALDVTARLDAGPSTADAAVSLSGGAVRIEVPAEAPRGSVIHAIVEARDDGAPMLTGYARVVVTVS